MLARLATLRSKLDALKARDRALETHGAYGSFGHHYREKPPLDEAGLARIESTCGVRLPDELRAFLGAVHGGGAGPGYGFDLTWPSAIAKVAQPFPFGDRDAATLLERRRTERFAMIPPPDTEDDGDDWPPGPGFLSLAHQGCGCFDVIVTTGEQRGRVWFFDMQWVPEHSANGQWGFFDWYESWLDAGLGSTQVGSAPPR